jgi:hypothetical protein
VNEQDSLPDNVIPFGVSRSRARRRSPPESRAHDVLIALADELFEMLPADEHQPFPGFHLSYMAASATEYGGPDADRWLSPLRQDCCAEIRLFVTETGETFWQGSSGQIYVDGAPIWPHPPMAFGVPGARRSDALTEGHEAAFLFLVRDQARWHLRIRVTTAIVSLDRLPWTAAYAPIPPDWLALAGEAVAEDLRDVDVLGPIGQDPA